MSCENAKFQSYSWSYGTTSFRVSELKYKIERQLIRLKELWDEYPNKTWRELQYIYFDKLVEEGIAKPTAQRKDKDARQKTSPLRDLGLITEDRKLTEIGEKLYRITKNNDFDFDNIFQVRNDSFIYLKQFLKIEFSENSNSRSYKEFKINPFLAIIYSILELGYLTKDEFTYLLPTCKNFNEVNELITDLRNIRDRNNERDFIETFLKRKIESLPNYQTALNCLLEDPLNIENFSKALMDRKSGKNTESYFQLFKAIVEYFQQKDSLNQTGKLQKLQNILNLINEIQAKTSVHLKRYFFSNDIRVVREEHIQFFEEKINFSREEDLYELLFYLFHLYKWIVNLEEYYDLNRRFLNLTDIFIFEHDKIYLDNIAYAYFELIKDHLLSETLLSSSKEEYTSKLERDLEISEISDLLYVPDEQVFNNLKSEYPEISEYTNIKEAILQIKKEKKKERFIQLIEENFDNEQLKSLFVNIKERNDSEVLEYTDWEADIPTIFEYLIGILWYKLNNYEGDLTDFFNLYLDANLLPRRFASGNKADIIFKLSDEDILLEATLTTRDSQRKMELEPVSRHLGKYILKNNRNAYAVFIAPYLDPNVLVVFRAYKILRYYDSNNPDEYINGLKIIPLSIDDLLIILDKGLDYRTLKHKFDTAFNDEEIDGYIWYKNVLKGRLE